MHPPPRVPPNDSASGVGGRRFALAPASIAGTGSRRHFRQREPVCSHGKSVIRGNLARPLQVLPHCAGWLVRRRVALTIVLLALAIALDVLVGALRDLLGSGGLGTLASGAAILAGLFLRSWAAGTIRKWERLATTGPYACVRHPLYLGSILLMLGFCGLMRLAARVPARPVAAGGKLLAGDPPGRSAARANLSWVARLRPARRPISAKAARLAADAGLVRRPVAAQPGILRLARRRGRRGTARQPALVELVASLRSSPPAGPTARNSPRQVAEAVR